MVLCHANFTEYELSKYYKTEHRELKNEKEGRKQKKRRKKDTQEGMKKMNEAMKN